jgi:hypothetical protein
MRVSRPRAGPQLPQTAPLFQNLILKRNAFRVVLLEPFFSGLANHVANLFACADKTLQECQPHFLADNLPDLDTAQGLGAVSYQMQELLPLYVFYLTTFHIDENEFRHVVGDFKLRFAGNLDIDSFSHFAPR